MIKTMFATAAALLAATPSAAAILYQESGILETSGLNSRSIDFALTPGARVTVRAEVASDAVALYGDFQWNYSYRTPACDIDPASPACQANEAFFYQPLTAVSPTVRETSADIPQIGGFVTAISRGIFFPGWSYVRFGDDGFPLEFNVAYRITVFDDAVPEPATWALMIAGFGMAGAAVRRRRPAVTFA